MPTFRRLPRFDKDYERLSPEERAQFKAAVKKFVEHLKSGGPRRKGLRVKGVQGATGIYEMTWADDGRATFEFGKPIRENEPHIVWRRVGGHDIFGNP